MHGFSALGLINLKSQCWAGSSSGWGSEEKSISKLILVVAVAGPRSLFHCVPLRRTILTSYSPPSSPSHVTPWSVYRKWKWKWIHIRLFATPWTVAYQVPPSMGFSMQECWSGLPLPSPGDLPDPGIEPRSPALQADALPPEPPGKSCFYRAHRLGQAHPGNLLILKSTCNIIITGLMSHCIHSSRVIAGCVQGAGLGRGSWERS